MEYLERLGGAAAISSLFESVDRRRSRSSPYVPGPSSQDVGRAHSPQIRDQAIERWIGYRCPVDVDDWIDEAGLGQQRCQR
jgi:hypothetical protein